jgi:GTP cyclohydrolase I
METVNPTAQAAASKIAIARSVDQILEALGLPTDDENFRDTPNRVSRYFLELCEAHLYPERVKSILKVGFPSEYDGMIVVPDVYVVSLCPHHLLPVEALISFAYIPGEFVVGLSKIPRFLQFLARQPILQEDLTQRIVSTFEEYVKPKGVAVIVNGSHSCVRVRGIQSDSPTITSSLSGPFMKDPATRAEFLSLTNESHNHRTGR